MSPNRPEILLVDDSPADLDLIRDALSSSSYPCNITTVLDGEEAIACLLCAGIYANAARPSLVLLDLNLPRKNGRVVLAECKAHPSLRSIPVVVFTTSRSPKDVNDCYAWGQTAMSPNLAAWSISGRRFGQSKTSGWAWPIFLISRV